MVKGGEAEEKTGEERGREGKERRKAGGREDSRGNKSIFIIISYVNNIINLNV